LFCLLHNVHGLYPSVEVGRWVQGFYTNDFYTTQRDHSPHSKGHAVVRERTLYYYLALSIYQLMESGEGVVLCFCVLAAFLFCVPPTGTNQYNCQLTA
jgi:hypothetical protein